MLNLELLIIKNTKSKFFDRLMKIAKKSLVFNPFPENVKILKGKDEVILRLRAGVYRIVYLADLNKRLVIILGINYRKSAYKNL